MSTTLTFSAIAQAGVMAEVLFMLFFIEKMCNGLNIVECKAHWLFNFTAMKDEAFHGYSFF